MEQRHAVKIAGGVDPRGQGKEDDSAADGDRGKPDSKLAVLGFELRGGPWVQFFISVAGVFGCGKGVLRFSTLLTRIPWAVLMPSPSENQA